MMDIFGSARKTALGQLLPVSQLAENDGNQPAADIGMAKVRIAAVAASQPLAELVCIRPRSGPLSESLNRRLLCFE
jgi:hypothetical protein